MKETTKELLVILRKFRDKPNEIYDHDYYAMAECVNAIVRDTDK